MIDATYFDGQTARSNAATVDRSGTDLVITLASGETVRWPLAGLHAIDPPADGHDFRLTHDSAIGARLILKDERFIDDLVSRHPNLKSHYGKAHLTEVVKWTAAGLAAVAALGWVTLNFLPGYVAPMLPDSWRNATGEQVEKSVAGQYKVCSTPAGQSAISAMVAKLAEGDPKLPPVKVTVYDWPLVNAFAVSGGRVILTRALLEAADSQDEVAGVLAHEIGHVAYYHPEQALIRVSGLQVLVSAATGTNGGDFVSNIAGVAALLRYSREAEIEADTYARKTLEGAKVNPVAFRSFFEKLLKISGEKKTAEGEEPSALGRIGNVFSTHPDTEERMKAIQPLPAGVTPVKVIDDAQWQALKNICKS